MFSRFCSCGLGSQESSFNNNLQLSIMFELTFPFLGKLLLKHIYIKDCHCYVTFQSKNVVYIFECVDICCYTQLSFEQFRNEVMRFDSTPRSGNLYKMERAI